MVSSMVVANTLSVKELSKRKTSKGETMKKDKKDYDVIVSKSAQCSSSVGLGTLLTIIFLILKLCKVIDWDWIFVFLPLIISTSLYFILLIIAFIVYYNLKKDE